MKGVIYMNKDLLLKIGQVGFTAVAAFLGMCLTQSNIEKTVNKRIDEIESSKSEDEA